MVGCGKIIVLNFGWMRCEKNSCEKNSFEKLFVIIMVFVLWLNKLDDESLWFFVLVVLF